MLKGNADDYDVVDMVQVLPDSLLADMRLYAPYDDVSSRSWMKIGSQHPFHKRGIFLASGFQRTNADLVCDVSG